MSASPPEQPRRDQDLRDTDLRPSDSRDPERQPDPNGKNGPPEPPRNLFTPVVISIILMMALAMTLVFRSAYNNAARIDYSFFRSELDRHPDGNLVRVTFQGETLLGEWKDPPDDPRQFPLRKEVADKPAASTSKESPASRETPPPKDTPASGSPAAKPGESEPTLAEKIRSGAAAIERRKLPKMFSVVLPPLEDRELINILVQKKVPFSSERQDWGQSINTFVQVVSTLLIVGVMFYIMRRASDPLGSGAGAAFIRSQAKRFNPQGQTTTFDDVAGMDSAKRELQEVVEYLKNPAKFQKLGAQIPKGILLVGPPGTGKTLMARATAGEAGVPFFSVNGSEFIQMYVGVGASRVRDMFREAKAVSPCLIFVDEIDAVGRVRGAGVGGGHDEREQTLNQILSEMDGFQKNEAVIVLAATNRPDVLDPALLRPGRFDRQITVDRPSRTGRLATLKVHTRRVPLASDVNLDRIAAGTIGFSGAELKNLVNEAALTAARENKNVVTMADFDQAKDRILMGVMREDLLTAREKEMTAYHEAGHAVLAWLLPDADPVHKITIIPRGQALGVTQLLPDEDSYSIGERKLRSQLIYLLGGRAAEKLLFDEYSAGAADDLKRATAIARRMVAHWGMSEVIGPVAFRQEEESPFLGKEMHATRQFSEETAHVIDQEIQRFLHEASSTAMQMLKTHRHLLDNLTRALLEKELLDQDEIVAILGPRHSLNGQATPLPTSTPTRA